MKCIQILFKIYCPDYSKHNSVSVRRIDRLSLSSGRIATHSENHKKYIQKIGEEMQSLRILNQAVYTGCARIVFFKFSGVVVRSRLAISGTGTFGRKRLLLIEIGVDTAARDVGKSRALTSETTALSESFFSF
jgi:hypothetical protein